MNKKIKIIACGSSFVLACLIAFVVTSLVTGKSITPSFGGGTASSGNGYSGGSVSVRSNGSSSAGARIEKDIIDTVAVASDIALPIPEIIVVHKEKTGKDYALKVVCKNIAEDVTVSYKIVEIDKTSNDGSFKNIPGSKDGKYTILANNAASDEIIAKLELDGFELVAEDASVQKMSVGQFQSLLLNQNDNSLLGGKNPRVARYVKLTCVGLNEGDYAAGDIQHVRDKIANGIWKTAVVLSVNYNERGQINAATIKPVYYE